MTNIKFYSQRPDSPFFPYLLIKRRQWDDYGYKTLFELLYVKSSDKASVQVGSVKIGYYGQGESSTQLPCEFFQLGNQYFSLGQSREYYMNLSELGNDLEREILNGLRDLRFTGNRNKLILDEAVVSKSLARYLGPLNLLNEPYEIGTGTTASESIEEKDAIELEFSCTLQGSKENTTTKFIFDADDPIPSRINLIIGKNGSGKTQYLANLVSTLTGINSTGIISSPRPNIQKVFAVSYSVFDHFFTPGDIRIPGSGSRIAHLDQQVRYEYVGIREKLKNEKYSRIVGPNTLSRKFSESIKTIQERDDYASWLLIMNPVLLDAGLADVAATGSHEKIRDAFRRLGAGHKVSLSILSRLYSNIVDDSLVVVDEPENHMHPSLLSSTLHVLQSILSHRDSFAIIATHSPIIAQDTPAKHIRLLKRVDGISLFSKIQIETLGTSIDDIITYFFGVSSELPGYRSLLARLAKDGMTLSQINQILERRLSVEASSYYASMGGAIE